MRDQEKEDGAMAVFVIGSIVMFMMSLAIAAGYVFGVNHVC